MEKDNKSYKYNYMFAIFSFSKLNITYIVFPYKK